MIPPPFEYHRATSLDDAARLLAKHPGEAKVLAGGHSLIPMMKLRLATPRILVDVGGLSDLSYVKRNRKQLAVGALTTHAIVAGAEDVKSTHGALAEAANAIGGSLAHADPAADYGPAVLAFDAAIVVKGASGARAIPAFKFFTGPLSTALSDDEIVTEIRLPILPGAGSAYEKLPQPASGFAVVGVCAVVVLDKHGVCTQARFAATGVADRAVRLSTLETALKGAQWSAGAIAAACGKADADVPHVLEDAFATEDYRRHLLRVIARRAAERAVP